jgi:hypothetical protein
VDVIGKETFLGERYWPGVSRSQLVTAERRMRFAVRNLARGGAQIRILNSTFIPADEVVLTLFEATDEDDVTEANRLSGFAFDRVRRVEVFPGTGRRRRDES